MGSISIVGLGHEPEAPLSSGAIERLKGLDRVVTPVDESSVSDALAELGIDSVSLSDAGLTPGDPVERVIEALLELSRDGDVAYVTGAYPFLKEGLLAGLLARTGDNVDVSPSLSPLQVILMAFDIDLTADLDIVDVGSLQPTFEQRASHLVVTGVRNPVLARKVSERLAKLYPPDHSVVVAGASGEDHFGLLLTTVMALPSTPIGDDAAVYVAPTRIAPPSGFDEFMRLIEVLRGPDGCPWDRAQDHMSLRRHLIEESYEVVAAIEADEVADELADELGDVLLQIALHSQLAAEEGRFTIDDVVARITAKIRRRHPHVFGDRDAATPDEVHAVWERVKEEEKSGSPTGLLDSVPDALPALMRAEKISRRVVRVGFEWESIDDVWEKFYEEIEELRETEPGSPEAAEEIGDALFTLVNVARKQGIDAEEALRGTCDKFARRWRHMELSAAERDVKLEELDLDALEAMWRSAKEAGA